MNEYTLVINLLLATFARRHLRILLLFEGMSVYTLVRNSKKKKKRKKKLLKKCKGVKKEENREVEEVDTEMIKKQKNEQEVEREKETIKKK